MNKQITLSAFTDELVQVITKKKELFAKINRIIPWSDWVGIIQPYYYYKNNLKDSPKPYIQ